MGCGRRRRRGPAVAVRAQVALGKAQNGHTYPVQAFVIAPPFLFSADWSGSIKVPGRTLMAPSQPCC